MKCQGKELASSFFEINLCKFGETEIYKSLDEQEGKENPILKLEGDCWKEQKAALPLSIRDY